MKTPMSAKFLQFILLPLFVFVLNVGWGQGTIIPVRTGVSGFASWTDNNIAGTTYLQLLTATSSTVTPAMNFDSYSGESLSFSARTFGGSTAAEIILTVSISVDNGSAWTMLGTRTPSSSTMTAQTSFDLSSYNGTQVKLKFSVGGTSNTIGVGIDDISITANATPTITSSGTLSAVNTTYGTASSSTSFNVSATNMSAGILVTPPAGYEVSLTSGSGYAPTVTVGSSGTIASTPVYVRLAATTAVGAYSGNIVLSSTSATSVNVATVSSSVFAKGLTITGLSAANKNYDGTTTVSVTGTAAFSGLVNGDAYTPTGSVTWAFPDANVGTNKVLTRTGAYTTPSSNYNLTQPSLTANISAIVSSAPAITAITPGNAQLSVDFTAPSANGGASITNYEFSINNGSSFTAFSPTQTATPLVISGLTNGTTYDVQIRAVNIAGSGTASNTVQGTPIAPADPTITVTPTLFASSFSTTYGTASAVQSFTVAAAAIDEDITVSAPTGFEISLTNNTGFASSLTLAQSSGEVASTTIYARLSATASVGNYNSIAISAAGGGAPEGSISSSSTGNAVSAKVLTITGLSVANKSYDGTATATVSGTAAYSGLANSETFAIVGSATATFASANVGNGIDVSVTGFSAPSSNYSISQPSFTANITAVNLTISGISISNKVYNGTNEATIAGTAFYQGLVNGQTFSITGTPLAIFTSVNVGTSISVTVSGYTAPSANYTISQPTGLTADITQANQSISFNALANKTTADVPFALTAAASSGLSISYTSSNTSVATISGSTVTIVGAGTTSITASQVGNENFNAATTVSQNFVVTLAPISLLTFDFFGITGSESTVNSNSNSPNIEAAAISRGAGLTSSANADRYNATNWAVTSIANAVSGNNYVEFTVTPNAGYMFSVSSILIQLQRSGTGLTAIALRSSVDNYAANLDAVKNVVDNTSTQSFTFSFTQTNSLSPVIYRLYGYAEAIGGTGGPGDGTGNDIVVTGTVSIPATPPSLTADATANTVDNNIDITHTADAAWTNAITAVKIGATSLTPTTDYVISSGNIQLLPSGGNSLLTTAGTKTITIVASGYTNATVTQVINAGIPTSNSTATINSILASGVTRTITCTAKDQYSNFVSGYAFKYDATVVNTTLGISESYSIEGSAITSTTNNVSLTATTNASGVATFTVQMPSLLDANDGISIQVQLANGSTNVSAAFAYYELPGQTITFNALNAVTYGDAAFTLSASGGASGNPVVFTSSNTNVAACTGVNGSTVTIIGAGNATITANQAGNAGYNAAAEVSQILVVNQKALTISGVGAADKVYNGSSAAVITGSPAYVGLVNSESFSVSGTGVAVFSDAEAGVGKTVAFSGYTAPSANYSLTQPTASATISQAAQSISFGSLPNRFVGGPTFTLGQNASSGLAITYVSSNTSVVTIVGNIVTPVGAGTTTITATQSGNNNYTAALSLTQNLTVIATPIAGWDFYGQFSPATFAATTFDTNLDATAGLIEITRGPGATANSAGNSFSTQGFQNNGISVANTDYFQVTLKADAGYTLSLSEINANFDGTGTFYAAPGVTSQYAYSLDGTTFTLIGEPVTSSLLKPDAVDLTGVSALQNLSASSTLTIRYYASGQTTTGGWRFSSPSAGVLGLAIGGSLCQIPTTPLISSTTFCVVGETGSISTSTSELNVNYELYDSNGVVPNSMKSGTGIALTWSSITDGNYYVVATNPLGDCSSTSAILNVAGTVAAYSYYLDSDSDGYGTGTAVLGCSSTVPAGYSISTGDCNNSNAAIYPTASEICGNNIDENCSGASDDIPSYYRTIADGNWGDISTWEVACSSGLTYTTAAYTPPSYYTGAVSIQDTHDVIIPANGVTYQTGTLEILSGGSLTLTGNGFIDTPTSNNLSPIAKLTVTQGINNSGTLTIGHQASLAQSSTTVANTGSGTVTVEAKLTGTNNGTAPNGRYWYIGSPMNNTSGGQFFDVQNMVRLWSYNGSNNSWGTIVHSTSNPTVTTTNKLIPGIGYLYRAGGNKTITYVGTAGSNLNNNITSNLLAPTQDATLVPVLGYQSLGYKFVANPYPSYIDWKLVTRSGLNVSYWIRNSNNTAYEAYNATTNVSTGSSGQTTQFIPPMQGFYVYAFTATPSLRIDNTDRVHSTNVLHAPTVNQVVRLKLNNGTSSDYTVVYENEVATNDLEEADTEKMFDYDFHQLYTLEGEHELALNGLLNATSKGSVNMGMVVPSNGAYTLEATDLEVEEAVILEDKFTNTFQDLKVNPIYSFTAKAGTFNNRFVLHFTETETVGVGETVGESDGVNVYTTTGQTVKVWVTNTAEFQNATVKVYDAIGNMIERTNMTSNELLLDLDIANGVYVVEVTGAEKVFTKKIFISK